MPAGRCFFSMHAIEIFFPVEIDLSDFRLSVQVLNRSHILDIFRALSKYLGIFFIIVSGDLKLFQSFF